MRILGISLTFYCLAVLPRAPRAAAVEATDPTREEVLDRARDLVNSHRAEEAAALLEGLRTQAVKENNQFSEVVILNSLGPVYEREAKYPEAESAYNRAIFLLTRIKGENAPDLIDPMGNLAALLYEPGQFSRAESLLVREIAVLNAIGKPDKQTATALAVLGKVYLSEHKYELAEDTAEDSLKIYAGIGEPDGLGSAFGYSILGAVSAEYGRVSDAEESLQQAISILEKALNPDDRRLGEGMANLGILYAAAGSTERGRAASGQGARAPRRIRLEQPVPAGIPLPLRRHRAQTGAQKEGERTHQRGRIVSGRKP